MARVTKENVKVGLEIWSAYDDRPIDGYGYNRGIVTDVFDDYYLFTDLDNSIERVWGDFDEEPCSVANFTTENEAKKWLGIK